MRRCESHDAHVNVYVYSCTSFQQHGKARFVVLFSDYLLVLKARRPNVPSKLGGVFNFQSSRIDWFSDLEYTAKKVTHKINIMHVGSIYTSCLMHVYLPYFELN